MRRISRSIGRECSRTPRGRRSATATGCAGRDVGDERRDDAPTMSAAMPPANARLTEWTRSAAEDLVADERRDESNRLAQVAEAAHGKSTNTAASPAEERERVRRPDADRVAGDCEAAGSSRRRKRDVATNPMIARTTRQQRRAIELALLPHSRRRPRKPFGSSGRRAARAAPGSSTVLDSSARHGTRDRRRTGAGIRRRTARARRSDQASPRRSPSRGERARRGRRDETLARNLRHEKIGEQEREEEDVVSERERRQVTRSVH